MPPRVDPNGANGGGGGGGGGSGGGGGGKRKSCASPPQPPVLLYRGMPVPAARGRRTMLFDPETHAKHRDLLTAVAAAVASAPTAADAKREGAPGWALSHSRACHQCCKWVAVAGMIGGAVGDRFGGASDGAPLFASRSCFCTQCIMIGVCDGRAGCGETRWDVLGILRYMTGCVATRSRTRASGLLWMREVGDVSSSFCCWE